MSIHHYLSLTSGSPVETTHERLITEIWVFWEDLSGSFSHLFTPLPPDWFSTGCSHIAPDLKVGISCLPWLFLLPEQGIRPRVCGSLRAADFSFQAKR